MSTRSGGSLRAPVAPSCPRFLRDLDQCRVGIDRRDPTL